MNTAVMERLPAPTGHAVSGARRDLAIYYLMGALACWAVAAIYGHLALLLAWPGMALAAVAFAYTTGWPGLFGKNDGRLSVWAYPALGPYILGRRVARWLQSRGRIPYSQLLPNLWIGRFPSSRDSKELDRLGVDATLDLTAEFSEIPSRRGEGYVNLPILDLTLPSLETLCQAVAIIDDAKRDGRAIYVHCALGYGRTAVVAAAYLLASGRCQSVDDAMAQVRSCRPGAVFPKAAASLLVRISTSRTDSGSAS